jgi:hypothetical protein
MYGGKEYDDSETKEGWEMKIGREKERIERAWKRKCPQTLRWREMLLNSKWQSINQDILYKKLIY